jgi:transcriptional regulator CtsR
MRNLADAIENFIIGELLRDHEDELMVRRNELAERLSCAPSQISYVLSTRFTPERGFLVESRRGSGGFVRIARVAHREQPTKELTADEAVEVLTAKRLLTARERILLKYMLQIIDADENKKKQLLQQAMRLLNNEGRG